MFLWKFTLIGSRKEKQKIEARFGDRWRADEDGAGVCEAREHREFEHIDYINIDVYHFFSFIWEFNSEQNPI